MKFAAESKKQSLLNMGKPEGWVDIFHLISQEAERGSRLVVARKNEDKETVERIKNCSKALQDFGYYVAENSWEIRIEW